MSKIQYSVIDLFAGCGGLSLGLYQAGWNGIFAIEKNPNAFETLNYNLIEGKIILIGLNGYQLVLWIL